MLLNAVHRLVRDCERVPSVRVFTHGLSERDELSPDGLVLAGNVAVE